MDQILHVEWGSSVQRTMLPGGRYPRVLLVMMTKVRAEDPINLLVRNQFGDWPKERLAQIHSGEPPGRGEFCGHYYRLQAGDRSLGALFRWLRQGVLGMVATDAIEKQAPLRPEGALKRGAKVVAKRLGDWMIDSGFWEIIFRIRLSKPLEQFVNAFKPDLIFCEGYSLAFASLPLLIAGRFHIPICFQTTDDWPSRTYRWSPVGWILRRRARELIRSATARLAFGEKMREEYERRYGVPFGVTYHLDEPGRFPQAPESPQALCRIVYTGSLGHRRYEALQDLLTAVRSVSGSAARFEVLVYCSGIPKDLPRSLLGAAEMKFAPLPAHEQLPSVLASATMLLLPESFNEARQAIEYSVSTKAHLYMMSGRPTLVYGPAYSGTVDYAKREGWGLVVSERSVPKLVEAISELLKGTSRLSELRANAGRCIQRHHGLTGGRERFRQALVSAAAFSGAPEGSQTDLARPLTATGTFNADSAKRQCACGEG